MEVQFLLPLHEAGPGGFSPPGRNCWVQVSAPAKAVIYVTRALGLGFGLDVRLRWLGIGLGRGCSRWFGNRHGGRRRHRVRAARDNIGWTNRCTCARRGLVRARRDVVSLFRQPCQNQAQHQNHQRGHSHQYLFHFSALPFYNRRLRPGAKRRGIF